MVIVIVELEDRPSSLVPMVARTFCGRNERDRCLVPETIFFGVNPRETLETRTRNPANRKVFPSPGRGGRL